VADDKSALLEQLRIERPAEVAETAQWPKWVAALVAVVAIGGAAAWLLMPRGVSIGVATVALAPADVAVGPGTILDASGYVVARRQATVSSKITGKVVEVTIEEGQRVERDEIIARLWENARYWKKGLDDLGFCTLRSTSPIVPVMVGSEGLAFRISRDLFDLGVFAIPVPYPVVPRGQSLIRTSVMPSHERDHLDRALDAFALVRARYDFPDFDPDHLPVAAVEDWSVLFPAQAEKPAAASPPASRSPVRPSIARPSTWRA